MPLRAENESHLHSRVMFNNSPTIEMANLPLCDSMGVLPMSLALPRVVTQPTRSAASMDDGPEGECARRAWLLRVTDHSRGLSCLPLSFQTSSEPASVTS